MMRGNIHNERFSRRNLINSITNDPVSRQQQVLISLRRSEVTSRNKSVTFKVWLSDLPHWVTIEELNHLAHMIGNVVTVKKMRNRNDLCLIIFKTFLAADTFCRRIQYQTFGGKRLNCSKPEAQTTRKRAAVGEQPDDYGHTKRPRF